MQYQVFVQSRSDSTFVASVIGVPNCTAEGSTREEAVANAKAVLEAQLKTGELVTIEVNSKNYPAETTVERKYAGIFADDPTFDDFIEKLAVIRKEANTVENQG